MRNNVLDIKTGMQRNRQSGEVRGTALGWAAEEEALRAGFINHILWIKTMDIEYARWRLIEWDKSMPWLELSKGVREAMK